MLTALFCGSGGGSGTGGMAHPHSPPPPWADTCKTLPSRNFICGQQNQQKTRQHSSRMYHLLWWPPLDVSRGWGLKWTSWTGLQWWPSDVSSDGGRASPVMTTRCPIFTVAGSIHGHLDAPSSSVTEISLTINLICCVLVLLFLSLWIVL